MDIRALITLAASYTGTRYKLAKTLGVQPSQIYDWEAGRATCTPADRARLAAISQQNPLEALVQATLDATEGTLRGEQLTEILTKPSTWDGTERRLSD